jgi:hypothetical protein
LRRENAIITCRTGLPIQDKKKATHGELAFWPSLALNWSWTSQVNHDSFH